MAITPQQFAVRARSFVNDLPDVERRGVESAALLVKNAVNAQLRVAVGADLRMSGVRKKGARVGARYEKGQSKSTAVVQAFGPMPLIENDTPPHRIPKVRGRRARKRVVVIPGVGVRAWAHHPGTKGKRPWERAINRSVPKVPAVIQAETGKALRKSFGG